MTRFRCPTTSASSIGSIGANPRRVDAGGRLSKVAKLTLRPDAGGSSSRTKSKRKRATRRKEKKAMIKEARKIDKLRNSIPQQTHFVFVGNIRPATTEMILKDIFRSCGPIEDISIRCTAGAAIQVGQDQFSFSAEDRQYAVIIFTRAKAVSRALKLNGSEILGAKCLVCLNAGELPEVRDSAQRCVNSMKERRGISRPAKVAGVRPLEPCDTEPYINPYGTVGETQTSGARRSVRPVTQPLSDNFRFYGMSFAKTVM